MHEFNWTRHINSNMNSKYSIMLVIPGSTHVMTSLVVSYNRYNITIAYVTISL